MSWKDDPVQRGIYQKQDREDAERTARESFDIEKGLMDGALLGSKIESDKARLRAKAGSHIDSDLKDVLEKIETCPGFMRLGREALEAGRSGLLSDWYKRIRELPMGTREASRRLDQLEEEVRRFREWLESRGPFPEHDALDRIGVKFDLRFDLSTLKLPPSWTLLDFSHLTRYTAESLSLRLESIAIDLFCLRSNNDIML